MPDNPNISRSEETRGFAPEGTLDLVEHITQEKE